MKLEKKKKILGEQSAAEYKHMDKVGVIRRD